MAHRANGLFTNILLVIWVILKIVNRLNLISCWWRISNSKKMTVKDKSQKKIIAKPFVKWAGGKGALVELLSAHLPVDFYDKKK